MAELNQFLNDIRIPTKDDKVYKDESVYDFDTSVIHFLFLFSNCF